MNRFTSRRRLLMSLSLFPAEPERYIEIGKYTSSGTFTAPEDGWFRIELQGSSGSGGGKGFFVGSRLVADQTTGEQYEEPVYYHTGGGGGGGGGCAVSEVKLKKGDTVSLTIGGVGSASKAVVNSSLESYSALNVTAAGNGENGSSTKRSGGSGGAGGSASGGNKENHSGKSGSSGSYKEEGTALSQASGGSVGYTGGSVGGKGAGADRYGNVINASAGMAGFAKVYRGDKNLG